MSKNLSRFSGLRRGDAAIAALTLVLVAAALLFLQIASFIPQENKYCNQGLGWVYPAQLVIAAGAVIWLVGLAVWAVKYLCSSRGTRRRRLLLGIAAPLGCVIVMTLLLGVLAFQTLFIGSCIGA